MIININIVTKKDIENNKLNKRIKKFMRVIDFLGKTKNHQVLIVSNSQTTLIKKALHK
jgi:hypothetical protein